MRFLKTCPDPIVLTLPKRTGKKGHRRSYGSVSSIKDKW